MKLNNYILSMQKTCWKIIVVLNGLKFASNYLLLVANENSLQGKHKHLLICTIKRKQKVTYISRWVI